MGLNFNLNLPAVLAETVSQVIRCKPAARVGYLLRNHRQTTILGATLVFLGPRIGSSIVMSSRSGERTVPCCGYVIKVGCFPPFIFLRLITALPHSGHRKDHSLVCPSSVVWLSDLTSTSSSLIIEDLERLRITELACLVYFYFDYREPKKQNIRGLLSSLLVQLCAQSDVCCGVLSTLYLARSHEIRQPNIPTLTQCLKDMLAALSSESVYIIIDGLNECPTVLPSPRGEILRLLKGISALRYPNLHICILSRAESDIKTALDPLTSHHASIHGESGQEQDIALYVKSLIESDTRMKKWPPKDKVYVVETLARRSLGV